MQNVYIVEANKNVIFFKLAFKFILVGGKTNPLVTFRGISPRMDNNMTAHRRIAFGK